MMANVRFEVSQGVATLTLNRPTRRNAIDQAMRDEIAQCVDAVQRDPAVRALVLTGAGEAFCGGGDLRSIQAAQLDGAGWRERMKKAHAWVGALIALDRPVIAAVDGPAFGAGFSLALAADVVIASPRARFCLSFMKLGLVPDFGAFYTLPRIVGVQRAKELMLSARELGVAEALQLGLVLEIVEADRLLARAQALAAGFAAASPLAVSLVKRALAAAPAGLDTLLDFEADAQALCFGSAEHRDALARFLDRPVSDDKPAGARRPAGEQP